MSVGKMKVVRYLCAMISLFGWVKVMAISDGVTTVSTNMTFINTLSEDQQEANLTSLESNATLVETENSDNSNNTKKSSPSQTGGGKEDEEEEESLFSTNMIVGMACGFGFVILLVVGIVVCWGVCCGLCQDNKSSNKVAPSDFRSSNHDRKPDYTVASESETQDMTQDSTGRSSQTTISTGFTG